MPKKKNEEIKRNEDPKKAEEQTKENNTNQQLGWVQILLLLGKPLWDDELKKWRVLNGYQSVLGNLTNLFRVVRPPVMLSPISLPSFLFVAPVSTFKFC